MKLLFILLVTGKTQPFDPIFISDNSDSFKPDDFYFYNSSKQNILAVFGSSKISLPTRKGFVVSPKGAIDKRYYNVALGVQTGKTVTSLSETRWPVSKINRSYIFFFADPKDGSVNFRAVDEYVPKPQ